MILVTGGTGLVGAHLLYELCLQKQQPKAIYRNLKGLVAVENVFKTYAPAAPELFSQIEWVPANLLDLERLKEVFIGVTTVYHCAAFISFDPNTYEKLQKVNVTGTANMVNLCLDFKVSKMCYVSSIAALGKAVKGAFITEETHWNITQPNVYALSKYKAELEVWRGIQEGLKATIINPGVILGPGFWNKGSSKLFRFAKKGSPLYFPGGSGFVGVQDVVRLMLLAQTSEHRNQRYICVAENLSYKEIFSEMANGFNHKKPIYKIPLWVLRVAWRLDYIKQFIFGGQRKITKQTVRSLARRDRYSAKKSEDLLGIKYTKTTLVIRQYCKTYLL